MTQNSTTGPRVVPRQINQQVDTIDLLELASVLWSKVLYIIVAALLCGVIALAYSVFMLTPKYSSTVTMYVNTGSLSLGSLSSITSSELTTSDKLVDLYITILKSRETIQEVEAESGVHYEYKDWVENIIDAKSGNASGVFQVTINSTSPNEAELIANTFAKVLPNRISDIVDGTSARVIEYAVVPSERSSPSYTKNVAMGLLIGAVICCAILTAQYLLNTSKDTVIHSVDELSALYPDIPVLATIMDMRQTSKKGYGYGEYYSSQPQKDEKTDKKSRAKKGA